MSDGQFVGFRIVQKKNTSRGGNKAAEMLRNDIACVTEVQSATQTPSKLVEEKHLLCARADVVKP